MEPISPDHPLRRLFAGLVEQVFCADMGLCCPSLTDYVADLLVDFSHIERLNVIRRAQGKRLEQIAAMLTLLSEEPPASRLERERTMYRHIGDFTLFWAGVYPEHLERSACTPSDMLLSYVSQGKRSYAIVSELGCEEDVLPASLFRHLSEDFEFCLYGLGLVRRGWETVERGGGELLY